MPDELKPFADLDDLKARWPDMPDGVDEYAETLLGDASQFIVDTVPEAVNASPRTLTRIVCAVVKRSMAVPDEYEGFSQVQMGAGPYQRSGTVANAHGDFYLTRMEKRALGGGRQKAFTIDLLEGSRQAWGDHDPR